MNLSRRWKLNKIGILLENISPKQLNMEVLESLNSIYKEDKNCSINLFVKHINWPFIEVPYGVFKLCDYNNFEGKTITTNIELLRYAKEVPNNNKIVLYCHTFPWTDTDIPAKDTISLLTNPEIDVYCRVDYIKEFITSFKEQVNVCTINNLIRELLWH